MALSLQDDKRAIATWLAASVVSMLRLARPIPKIRLFSLLLMVLVKQQCVALSLVNKPIIPVSTFIIHDVLVLCWC